MNIGNTADKSTHLKGGTVHASGNIHPWGLSNGRDSKYTTMAAIHRTANIDMHMHRILGM